MSEGVRGRRPGVALMALGAAVFVALGGSSSADVVATTGSAFGASGAVSLFGGTPIVLLPTPLVQLASAGGHQSGSAPSAVLQAGPARVVHTGMLSVDTQGTTGSTGAVTSSATVIDPSVAGLTATEASSTCTSTESGSTGSATIVGGHLVISNDPVTGDPVTTVDIPASPPPNDTLNGTVNNVGDSFKVVFNEQVVTADSITVNAAHFYLLGPIAVGDLFLGRSECGVSAMSTSTSTSTTMDSASSSTTSSSTTTSSTTTSLAPAVVATTVPGSGTPASSGGPTSSPPSALARTGYSSKLMALAGWIFAVGVLLLVVPGRRRASWPRRHRW